MLRSSLYRLHQQQGARFDLVDGWELPLRFSAVEQEYRAARSTVALADRSPIGRLQATGKDTLDLLNRLSTNRVDTLAAGSGATTVFATDKGRIVDWVTLLAFSDHLLLLTAPEARGPVAQWIDRYTFTEEASIQDVTDQTAMLCLLGPRAAEAAERVLGSNAGRLARYGCTTCTWHGVPVQVARTDPTGGPGFDLVVPAEQAPALWHAMLDGAAALGIAPAGEETLEVLRVEAGIPRYGRELGERYNPLEARLEQSISSTKGCYIGQEVIARLETYQKLQRTLVGLLLESEIPPPAESPVLVAGREAGRLTSAVRSPGLGRAIALAYLRLPHARPGVQVQVQVQSDGQLVQGQVLALPFVPQ